MFVTSYNNKGKIFEKASFPFMLVFMFQLNGESIQLKIYILCPEYFHIHQTEMVSKEKYCSYHDW